MATSRGAVSRAFRKRWEISVGNTPALADVDGAEFARLDPLPDGGFGYLQPLCKILNCLIPIIRHELSLRIAFSEEECSLTTFA